MFLAKVSEQESSRWSTTVSQDAKIREIFAGLIADKYELYYSFDYKKQRFLYEAYPKNENLPYLGCYVDSNHEIMPFEHSSFAFASVLALYIYQKDSKKTETELRETYGSLYDSLKDVFLMSREDVEYRSEKNDLIQKLAKEMTISRFSISGTKGESLTAPLKVKMDYNLLPSEEKTVYVRLRVGLNKLKFAKNPVELLGCAVSTGNADIGEKKKMQIGPDNFTPEDQEVMKFLAVKSAAIGSFFSYDFYYRSEKNGVHILKSDAASFFSYFQGRSVNFNDERYQVRSGMIFPKITVKENGMFQFEPSVSGGFYLSGLIGAFLDKERKTITIGHFNSEAEGKLFAFEAENPGFRYDLFRSEISDTILPLVDQNVEITEGYKEKHPYTKRSICYYVDYLEDKEILSCHTVYKVGDAEVDSKTFDQNNISLVKNEKFHQGLENLKMPEVGMVKDPKAILNFMKADLSELQSVASVYLSENISKKKVTGVGALQVRTSSGVDWLQVSLSSEQYSPEEMDEILAAFRKKKKFVRLSDRFISFEDEDSEDFCSLVHDLNIQDINTKQLPLYQALKLASYESENIDVSFDEEIRNLLEEIKSYKNQPLDLDPDFLQVLRPYQMEGVRWMKTLERHNLAGILADDMGLGKTLQVIALMSTANSAKPSLIVCPKSLIYNWENEFHKWNPYQEVIVIDGDKSTREAQLVMNQDKNVVFAVSYDSLRNDLEEYQKRSFHYIVLDEGQNIANVSSKRTRAVKALHGEHLFVLTGTPIQNSLLDLWSIFDFLLPGYLPSFVDFKKDYGTLTLDQEEKDLLMRKIAPFVLKRTKDDVLKDLPPKEEQVTIISMAPEQRKYYDAYLQRARDLAEGDNKIVILAELTRLRQICVDPSMFLENYTDVSDKMLYAVKLISDALENGHKVLLFSSFVKTLNHLTDLLSEKGISSQLICGDTPAKQRLEMANEFNNTDQNKVMLVSLKAGGTGLNLVGADIVVHLDPWWNVAAENQASDRAHRIGQTRPVTIIKLVCKDTIEERVIELQEKKKELTAIIGNGDENLSAISSDDIRFLLS